MKGAIVIRVQFVDLGLQLVNATSGMPPSGFVFPRVQLSPAVLHDGQELFIPGREQISGLLLISTSLFNNIALGGFNKLFVLLGLFQQPALDRGRCGGLGQCAQASSFPLVIVRDLSRERLR